MKSELSNCFTGLANRKTGLHILQQAGNLS
jgi:hypothetical protein